MEREQNLRNPPHVWDRDYSMPGQPSPSGPIRGQILHGGRGRISKGRHPFLAPGGCQDPAGTPLPTTLLGQLIVGHLHWGGRSQLPRSLTAPSGNPATLSCLYHRRPQLCPGNRYLPGDSEADSLHQELHFSAIFFCVHPTQSHRGSMYPILGNRLQKLSHNIASILDELKEILDSVPKLQEEMKLQKKIHNIVFQYIAYNTIKNTHIKYFITQNQYLLHIILYYIHIHIYIYIAVHTMN